MKVIVMRNLFGTCIPTCIALVSIICSTERAEAGSIVGGSTLVSASDELQLEAWLGQGSLTLTNIFTKTVGNGKTSVDFHAASDGNGPTFSVIEILGVDGFAHQIIGGFNPQSWSSINDYNHVPDPADRTAFVFNLTDSTKFSEKLGGSESLQTFNASDVGPTFGFGNDLYTSPSLSYGYSYQYSYGAANQTNDGSLIGKPWNGFPASYYTVGTIEVFTITQGNISAVPEPSSFALAGLGGLGLAFGAYRRRQAAIAV